MKKWIFVSLVSLFVLPTLALAEGKVSGLVFGDLFYNAKSNSAANENDLGMWIRRGYFTYDYNFDETLSTRVRLEFNSPDLAKASAVMTPFIKEASLAWKTGGKTVQLGLIPTPTWDLVETHWGYRFIEKTPADLQKFGSAVDLGASIKGTFGSEGMFGYHLMAGNGAGAKSEVADSEEKVYGAFYVKPMKDLVVQVYGDFEPASVSATRRATTHAFAGYTQENWRGGILFVERIEQQADDSTNTYEILSVHGAHKLCCDKLWGFARVDRLFDPSVNGAGIEYIPFDITAKATFAVLGVDYEPAKDIHFAPNIETVIYDEVAGARPDATLTPRLTFFWKF
jgi:hypothetical protein